MKPGVNDNQVSILARTHIVHTIAAYEAVLCWRNWLLMSIEQVRGICILLKCQHIKNVKKTCFYYKKC